MVKLLIQKSLAGLFILLTGCSNAMSTQQTEFEWLATESAPKPYPMKIIDGTFFYKGKDHGLYIPSGGTLYAGWGQGISNHVVGEKFKPLPDRLEITFFSFTEKQFYKGKFDLPYEHILKLFQEGVELNKSLPNKEIPYYSGIMVGIAPGGEVAVWLKGKERYVEVFFGKAEKTTMSPQAAFGMPFNSITPEAYIQKRLVDSLTEAEYSALKKNGIPFGLWSRYRNKYLWRPVFTSEITSEDINLQLLNGESETTFLYKEKPKDRQYTTPSSISFDATVDGKSRYYIVTFNEFEILDAFEKLGADGQQIYLEFDPRVPRETTKVRVYNDKESIELTKAVTKK